MITIFTIPKPHNNSHIATIQANALKSWQQLNIPIIVIGSGKGIRSLAASCGATYIPRVKVNSYGTPLLDDAFAQARKYAKTDLLMFSNADIIYGPALLKTIKYLPHSNFLAVGARWDVDISKQIIFEKRYWDKLVHIKNKIGTPHPPLGSDYFIFSKKSFTELPSFAVGRIKWDNWMMYHALKKRMKLIDCSKSIVAIHQNHDYTHQINHGIDYLKNRESVENSRLAGKSYLITLLDANWQTIDSLLLSIPKTILERITIWLKIMFVTLQ